jgi:hypothetical protein
MSERINRSSSRQAAHIGVSKVNDDAQYQGTEIIASSRSSNDLRTLRQNNANLQENAHTTAPENQAEKLFA